MVEKEIQTGNPDLDKALNAFFKAFEGSQLESLKKVVANKDISREEFEEVVSGDFLNIVIFLHGSSYQKTLSKVSPEAHPFLENAKELIETHIPDILEHPAAIAMAREIWESSKKEDPVQNAMNSFTGFSRIPMWLGEPPKLIPAVRIIFFNRQQKPLADSTMAWDDVAFLSSSLLRVLADTLESGKTLAEHKQFDLSEKENVRKYLKELNDHLDKIKRFAPLYELTLE